MNEADKKRFARYRPGYIEPPPQELEDAENQETNNGNRKTSEKVKDTLGFVEKINVNQDDLINQVLSEMAMNK